MFESNKGKAHYIVSYTWRQISCKSEQYSKTRFNDNCDTRIINGTVPCL